MSILTINNLTHSYDNKTLFEDASLCINYGEHIGIVGLNGAGKSTFMNILVGSILQDEGEVKWLNGIRWGYLDQHTNIDRSLTVMEYLKQAFDHLYSINSQMEEIYEQMCSPLNDDALNKMIEKSSKLMDYLTMHNFFDIESTIKKVANGLGINNLGYDTLIATLSGGQRAKLMLANLLLGDNDVMLLDEPTNFLDNEHIDWLVNYLSNMEGTYAVISHDVSFLNKVCTVILSVENKQIKRYSGNYDDYISQHEQNSKQYAEDYERQQREIKKMEEYINKNKARAATAGMANSRKKMLERIEVLDKPVTFMPSTIHFPYEFLYTKNMLEVNNAEIGYNGQAILPPINMKLSSDTKMWIKGTNGIGKTTLLKTLMNKIQLISGNYKFHLAAKILYLEQDINWGYAPINAMSYINNLYPSMNIKEVRTRLGNIGLQSDLMTKPINQLSGGEQVKVKLCALIIEKSNILLLDEPTNHLDVTAKESLAEAIKEYQGAVILVSHEATFAESVCNDLFTIK